VSRQRERERRGERGSQREQRRAPVPRPALRRPRLDRRLVPLLAILVAGALGTWALVRQRTTPPPLTSISTTTMLDSALVTLREQDWKDALHWARLLVAAEPSNPAWVLHLGVISHNYSFTWSKVGRIRSVTRTSLERIELESRALAFMDSAAAWTRSDEQWADAKSQGGQVNEALGLPLEALQYYIAACERVPDYPAALPHAVFIEKSLRDPPTIPSGTVTLRNP
jgi:hypothetical protein